MRPDLALRIDIRCYFRLVAAPVIVFAREFIQTLQFSLLFTIATLWTAPGSAPLGWDTETRDGLHRIRRARGKPTSVGTFPSAGGGAGYLHFGQNELEFTNEISKAAVARPPLPGALRALRPRRHRRWFPSRRR